MENDRRRQRPTTVHIHDLADELLELVLLRVSSPRCLIRAAAACKPWRRLIADGGFLRRFGSLHAPLILGHFCLGANTIFVPSAVTPLGKALADFLTSASNYMGSELDLIDCRRGLLAFVATIYRIVVCDPLTRKYRDVHLPQTWVLGNSSVRLGFFLLDNDTDDDEMATTKMHMSNIRMLHVRMVENNGSLTAKAFVFSAREGSWLWLSSGNVGDLLMARADDLYNYIGFVGRAGGSFCWWSYKFRKILHLDMSTQQFSSFTLPEPVANSTGIWNLHVVGKGTHAAIRLVRILGGSDLEVLKLAHGYEQCVVERVERRVSLNQLSGMDKRPPCRCCSWRVLDKAGVATGGHVVLLQDHEGCRLMFFLDVEAMVLKRKQKIDCLANRLFSYEMPWPPTLNECV